MFHLSNFFPTAVLGYCTLVFLNKMQLFPKFVIQQISLNKSPLNEESNGSPLMDIKRLEHWIVSLRNVMWQTVQHAKLSSEAASKRPNLTLLLTKPNKKIVMLHIKNYGKPIDSKCRRFSSGKLSCLFNCCRSEVALSDRARQQN